VGNPGTWQPGLPVTTATAPALYPATRPGWTSTQLPHRESRLIGRMGIPCPVRAGTVQLSKLELSNSFPLDQASRCPLQDSSLRASVTVPIRNLCRTHCAHLERVQCTCASSFEAGFPRASRWPCRPHDGENRGVPPQHTPMTSRNAATPLLLPAGHPRRCAVLDRAGRRFAPRLRRHRPGSLTPSSSLRHPHIRAVASA
jgi:hypothetical protein